MTLSTDELSILSYLARYCPTANRAGSLVIGIDWKVKGSSESHTILFKEHFNSDWNKYIEILERMSQLGIVGIYKRSSVIELWITQAGQSEIAASLPVDSSPPRNPLEDAGDGIILPIRATASEKVIGGLSAIVGIALIAYVVIRNEPFKDLNIVTMLRGLVALSFAVAAATIPGFLLVSWQGWGLAVRAGGAIAVFVLSLIFTPTALDHNGNKPPSHVPPPKVFAYAAYEGPANPKLPVETLGDASDDRSQPRQWMWAAEDNAEKRLGSDCIKLWVLTSEFAVPYHTFTVHLNVGTVEDVIVSCRLLQQGTMPPPDLPRTKDSPTKGPLFDFTVPESRAGDQLLFFIALKKSSYQAMTHDPKFRISTN